MAKIFEWTEENKAEFDTWLKGKSDAVQVLTSLKPPNLLYRMKSTGHRVPIISYNDNWTLSVYVSGTYNFVTFERTVFGVPPEDLVECDLPGPDDPLGYVLEKSEVENILRTSKENPFAAVDELAQKKLMAMATQTMAAIGQKPTGLKN